MNFSLGSFYGKIFKGSRFPQAEEYNLLNESEGEDGNESDTPEDHAITEECNQSEPIEETVETGDQGKNLRIVLVRTSSLLVEYIIFQNYS